MMESSEAEIVSAEAKRTTAASVTLSPGSNATDWESANRRAGTANKSKSALTVSPASSLTVVLPLNSGPEADPNRASMPSESVPCRSRTLSLRGNVILESRVLTVTATVVSLYTLLDRLSLDILICARSILFHAESCPVPPTTWKDTAKESSAVATSVTRKSHPETRAIPSKPAPHRRLRTLIVLLLSTGRAILPTRLFP